MTLHIAQLRSIPPEDLVEVKEVSEAVGLWLCKPKNDETPIGFFNKMIIHADTEHEALQKGAIRFCDFMESMFKYWDVVANDYTIG